MARMLLASWWATVLRGLAALGLALLWLAHAPAMPVTGAGLFGAYAVVDGLLCGLVVIRAERRPRTALPTASIAGVGVGSALLVAPHVVPAMLAFAMSLWAFAVGVAALAGWHALYHATPAQAYLVALASGRRVRRLTAPEFGMLLAGALALTFAVAILTLVAARIAVSPGLVGLFAAPFGYLHLRAGLSLGMLALATADAVGHTDYSVAEGDLPAMGGGAA